MTPGNGLPVIASEIIIDGRGATITRDDHGHKVPKFRILFVGPTGNLTLTHTTIRGGFATDCPAFPDPPVLACGGISNTGKMKVTHSKFIGNTSRSDVFAQGGAIDSPGTGSVSETEVTGKHVIYSGSATEGGAAGGAIANDGPLTVTRSRLTENTATVTRDTQSTAFAAGIISFAEMTVEDTIVSKNRSFAPGGIARAAVSNGIPAPGRLTVTGGAISDNTSDAPHGVAQGGGLANAWRRSLELRETQLVIAGATGVTTPLLRPPYSSTGKALDDADWSAVVQAGQEGYLTVLTTLDSEDWRRPGVEQIVAGATPKDTAGQIVLLHDAGGDRTQTVAALEELVPRLKASGWTFATVGDAVALRGSVQPAAATDRWQGLALITAIRTSDWILEALSWLLWAAGAISLLRAVAVFVAARRHVRMRRKPWGAPVTEPVSVIVPAYNESAGIEAAVRSLVASDHQLEVIVVDDGSTDGTADVVEALRLPGVRVIRQQNAGKPAALNTGIAAASCNLLVMVDGDTVFEPDAVRMLVQPFAHRRVGAVSGNAKVVNRGGLLGRWQHIEYVVGFNLDRRLFDLAECMPTVPGAVGAFRREALLRVGGVSDTTLAEDTDLTMALCRDGWRVVYEERAKAWTEAPASLGALWKQRYRWCYGTLQAMWKHRGALGQRGQAGSSGDAVWSTC
ncbi:bifunctional polysaccharide deacetylase/glycosyltransferase family 2 protein [Streptomyces nojiriensis]|uniref:bifunctional polysaccharide deacetylase/glycosyltransferase family 2 protein n=1 Tax=Streptomyces nojiriensis TaxID=66374 RepID=UPI002E16BE2E